jgi:hypothetical protein
MERLTFEQRVALQLGELILQLRKLECELDAAKAQNAGNNQPSQRQGFAMDATIDQPTPTP